GIASRRSAPAAPRRRAPGGDATAPHGGRGRARSRWSRPRPPYGAVASPPGALRRGAAGAAAVLPRRSLCAAEMAQGRDAHRPPVPDDAVDRAVARRGSGTGIMTRFIVTRLLQVLAVLVVMSFIIYALIGLMPGDPIDQMLTADPHLT